MSRKIHKTKKKVQNSQWRKLGFNRESAEHRNIE